MAQASYGEEECLIAKTNHSCTLTIDRRNPLAPPTIQMYPGQTLKVQLKNPYYFERYFMDYQSGQIALAPDVASSIVSGLLTPLKNAEEIHFAEAVKPDCTIANIGKITPTDGPGFTAADAFYTACFAAFLEGARGVYLQLEREVAPDALSFSDGHGPFAGNNART